MYASREWVDIAERCRRNAQARSNGVFDMPKPHPRNHKRARYTATITIQLMQETKQELLAIAQARSCGISDVMRDAAHQLIGQEKAALAPAMAALGDSR